MKLSRFLSLCLPVIFTLAWTTQLAAQSAGSTPAEKLYWEAIALHMELKYNDALAKAKEAAKLDSTDPIFAYYVKELEGLQAIAAFEEHALKAPPEAEKSVASLAKYLVQPAKDQHQKAHLIYRWITDRIAYDDDTLYGKRKGDQSIEAVLRDRKAVCEGYSSLFLALAKEAGIEAVKIKGTAKGVSLLPHAWNAIKIDNKWFLIDSTWGAGVSQNGKWSKRYRDYFFEIAPEKLAITHSPSETQWQLLAKPIAREDFQRWPKASFHLLEYGINPSDLMAKMQDKSTKEVVQALQLPPGPPIKLLSIPLEQPLKDGASYTFRIEAPGVMAAVLHDGSKALTRMTKKGPVFEGTVTPQKGKLYLVVQFPEAKKQFRGVVAYNVE
jgi:hypothetical protein